MHTLGIVRFADAPRSTVNAHQMEMAYAREVQKTRDFLKKIHAQRASRRQQLVLAACSVLTACILAFVTL